ncbi:MAG: hypothetical protein J07HQW1_01075 [Haloquadratum walsbyi J07HQW1]|uniref:Uncharacterized protein n=1 Tax=Haloquadratum walsbyi J07HQW1 TaxID=1238424 RepID=U1N3T6_9EURY|nr:MAG: hypothetical protein J07HQW1_01075 [Haloquadratum walsbyi J07HQW1]
MDGSIPGFIRNIPQFVITDNSVYDSKQDTDEC